MPLDDVALTTFSPAAGAIRTPYRADCEEVRIIGRDLPLDGLLLPQAVVAKAEEIAALAQLDALASMPLNWDGFGGLQIHSDTVANAASILSGLIRYIPAPDITPNPNGTLSFEWSTTAGYAHLEIGKTRYSFVLKPTGAAAVLAEGSASTVPTQLGPLISAILFTQNRPVAALTKLSYIAGDERLTY